MARRPAAPPPVRSAPAAVSRPPANLQQQLLANRQAQQARVEAVRPQPAPVRTNALQQDLARAPKDPFQVFGPMANQVRGFQQQFTAENQAARQRYEQEMAQFRAGLRRQAPVKPTYKSTDPTEIAVDLARKIQTDRAARPPVTQPAGGNRPAMITNQNTQPLVDAINARRDQQLAALEQSYPGGILANLGDYQAKMDVINQDHAARLENVFRQANQGDLRQAQPRLSPLEIQRQLDQARQSAQARKTSAASQGGAALAKPALPPPQARPQPTPPGPASLPRTPPTYGGGALTPPGPPNQGLPPPLYLDRPPGGGIGPFPMPLPGYLPPGYLDELFSGIPLPDIFIEDPVQSDQYFRRLGEEYMRNRSQIRDPNTGLPPGVERGPFPVRELPGQPGQTPALTAEQQQAAGYVPGFYGSPEYQSYFSSINPTGPQPVPPSGGRTALALETARYLLRTGGQSSDPMVRDTMNAMMSSGQPGMPPSAIALPPGMPRQVYFDPLAQSQLQTPQPTSMPGPQVQPPQMTAQAAPNPNADLMSQYLGIAQNIAGTMNR